MDSMEKSMEKTEQPAVGMPSLLTVSPSPHARRGILTPHLMLDVIIALLPTSIWGCYVYGWRAVTVLLAATLSAVLFEALFELLLRKPLTVADGSAALTGLLLGLNLSPAVPFYVPVVGSAFAIIIVKQLFGGIGKNIMNPALAARVFLVLCWTSGMTKYPAAYERNLFGADVVASATPLASLKTGAVESLSLFDLFFGRVGGSIGEISAFLILVGGIVLLCRKVISWQIPVSMLGTVAILTFLFPQGGADRLTFMAMSLCSGGLMLGAFFMATDYVTSPVTPVGRLIYGAGCGLLVVFLRTFSDYPEGVSFAILIMNSLVWYLDMATKPRVYGKPRREKKQKGGAVK